MNTKISYVKFDKFGSYKINDSIYFGVNLSFLKEGGIRLYDCDFNLKATIILDSQYCVGEVFSFKLKDSDEFSYYRYFSDETEFTDPYSRVVFRNSSYGDKNSVNDVFSIKGSMSLPDNLTKTSCLYTEYCDSLFYEVSVRGGSMLSLGNYSKGTFKALQRRVNYYKDLGITALILLPCYEFIECEEPINHESDYRLNKDKKPDINFWGFKKGYYFTIKKAFCETEDSCREFSAMVDTFHKNSIEIIMTMYFDRNVTDEYISEVLKYYVINYKIDGFRIVGADINIDKIVMNPFLKNTKLLLKDGNLSRFDNGKPLLYKNLSFFDMEYTDTFRSFVKGDEDKVKNTSFLLRANNRVYHNICNVTDFNGFTLWDTFSYSEKHNELNGENNTDGNNYNFSWNCGCEGPTRKSSINRLRVQMCKNLLLMSFLSQGTPLLLAGDELLNSQNGNNNPWNQDNETGWTTYSKASMNKGFLDFVKNLSEFRKRHIILHQKQPLKFNDYLSSGLPDISFHGIEPFTMNQDPVSRQFAVLFCGDYSKQYKKEKESSLYIVFNMYWEAKRFSMPVTKKAYKVSLLFCSDNSTPQDFDEKKAVLFTENEYLAPERSISIFLIDKI